MTTLRTAAVLAIAGSCLLPAACASSHQAAASSPARSTSTTGQDVAKSTFVARASAACLSSNGQLRDAAGHAFAQQRPTAAAWRAFMVRTALPIISHRLDAIAALPRPGADNATIAAIVKAGKAAVAAATDNPGQLSPASSVPFDTYDRLVTAYGIQACDVGS